MTRIDQLTDAQIRAMTDTQGALDRVRAGIHARIAKAEAGIADRGYARIADAVREVRG